ncbi:hypothetical protein LEP1GSC196_2600 [Leptospira meyeri serovar Semaranga str. Veldrot Semarang 173]|nr:hypothetical protein LEP1GSC196_2600 [Leptospira meyeri serovar Semaranga str. Veldrot Semarang 173]
MKRLRSIIKSVFFIQGRINQIDKNFTLIQEIAREFSEDGLVDE